MACIRRCVRVYIQCMNVRNAGRKSDSWMAVDSLSGKKLHYFSSDGVSTTCPLSESHGSVIRLARTGTMYVRIYVVRVVKMLVHTYYVMSFASSDTGVIT